MGFRSFRNVRVKQDSARLFSFLVLVSSLLLVFSPASLADGALPGTDFLSPDPVSEDPTTDPQVTGGQDKGRICVPNVRLEMSAPGIPCPGQLPHPPPYSSSGYSLTPALRC